jgi:uncharacterized protein YceK
MLKILLLYFRIPSGCASVLQVITLKKNYDRKNIVADLYWIQEGKNKK